MLISLEPWSIILILISALETAVKTLAAVPLALTIPRPTTAIKASPSSIWRVSGSHARLIPPKMFFFCFSVIFEETMTHIVSIPEGICSNVTPSFSITSRTFLPKPTSAFIWSFSIVMTEKPFFPAIPVTIDSLLLAGAEGRIIVPGAEGSFVFLIFIGIPANLTGKIASS